MTTSIGFASSLQVVLGSGGGTQGHPPQGPAGCLGFILLSLLAFLILKARAFLKRVSKGQPEFTNLRATGKTIVPSNSSDEEEDQPGVVN